MAQSHPPSPKMKAFVHFLFFSGVAISDMLRLCRFRMGHYHGWKKLSKREVRKIRVREIRKLPSRDHSWRGEGRRFNGKF